MSSKEGNESAERNDDKKRIDLSLHYQAYACIDKSINKKNGRRLLLTVSSWCMLVFATRSDADSRV